jgi:rod shape determining protein RodA
MFPRRILGYDARLMFGIFGLLTIGLHLLLTGIADPTGGGLDRSFGIRQLIFLVPAGVVFVLMSRLPLQRLEPLWPALWCAAISMIVVVFVLGAAIRGSRRWIELGPVNLQPSETGKVLIVLALAGFLATRVRDLDQPRVFIQALALGAIPAALVFLQPDFGTAQIYGYITLAAMFFAGARWLHGAVLGGVFLVLVLLVFTILPAVGMPILKPFQMQRITGFLNPEQDPRGSNYQAIQAKIAIGSGQLFGKPASEASQVRQAFLPEPQTDFVFATLVERRGFLGGALVIAIYGLIISRCLAGVANAPTMFGRLACGGVGAMYGAQVMINVGMVIGLTPITGVPLPLLSYGGSAMIANLAALGIVAGVLASADRASVRYERRSGRLAVPTLASLQRQRPKTPVH